ncbi:MAG TPA: sigma-70 family RNA polymerase sigma factor [Acidimicrobiales bacterium]
MTAHAPADVDPYVKALEGSPDPASYEAAFAGYFMLAMRAAWRVTGDRTASEDVAAETMARAFARWDRLHGLAYLEAWIQRVAINLAIDWDRRRRPHIDTRNPPDAIEATIGSVDLVSALRRLSRRQREAVVLHYLLDMPIELVAVQLRLSDGAVRSHLHRGVQKLRAILSIEGVNHV